MMLFGKKNLRTAWLTARIPVSVLGCLLLLPVLACSGGRGGNELDGGSGKACSLDTECLYGLRCHEGVCTDRSLVAATGGKGLEVSTEELLEQEQKRQETTRECIQHATCRDFGLCQGTPDGHCVVATDKQCRESKITCGERGFCTFVKDLSKCCRDARGKDCEWR